MSPSCGVSLSVSSKISFKCPQQDRFWVEYGQFKQKKEPKKQMYGAPPAVKCVAAGDSCQPLPLLSNTPPPLLSGCTIYWRYT